MYLLAALDESLDLTAMNVLILSISQHTLYCTPSNCGLHSSVHDDC